MSLDTDQSYLKEHQYKDGGNLNARIELHARFSTNPQGWYPWVFEQLDLPPDGRILELGCGTGAFWAANAERACEGWDVLLTDLSPGMIAEAEKTLQSTAFRYAVMDAQCITLDDDSLDAVIANHMLYHVPDRAKALSEIRRVLKPGGRLYATTVGRDHLREIGELLESVGIDREHPVDFTLENGADELSAHFSGVELRLYPDSLRVTEVELLISYILSMGARSLTDAHVQSLRQKIADEIALHGACHVTKSSGMFICSA